MSDKIQMTSQQAREFLEDINHIKNMKHETIIYQMMQKGYIIKSPVEILEDDIQHMREVGLNRYELNEYFLMQVENAIEYLKIKIEEKTP